MGDQRGDLFQKHLRLAAAEVFHLHAGGRDGKQQTRLRGGFDGVPRGVDSLNGQFTGTAQGAVTQQGSGGMQQ